MITKPVKYTPEFVLAECTAMIQEAQEDKELLLIGQLFETRDYSAQRLSEWTTDFADNDQISESIKKIKELFENRINLGGLKGDLNSTMTVFNLKNNYGWRDKPEEAPKGDGMAELFSKLIDKLPN